MSTSRLLRSQPVKIVCPGCGAVCEASVEHRDGDPWPTYCHDCEHCGCVITESEWEEAGLRKARRPGKVLARGYYCGTNAAGHHMVCPVGHGCALEGRAALCRHVEVREVPKRRAGR